MSGGARPEPLWLLLLPSPPSEVSLNSLRVAFASGLTQILQIASKASVSASNVILDIAITYGDDSTFSYSEVQKLLGLMYRLICVICTEQRIDLEYGNDVDARIVLIHAARDSTRSESVLHRSTIDLETLASTNRAWERFCSLESESGEILLREFLRARNESSQQTISKSQIERLPGGLTIRQYIKPDTNLQQSSFHRHHSVAVGGTFDHLHAGHKLLLTMTALVLDPQPSHERCLTIGITGDDLLNDKQYREELEDFGQRQSAVQNFLLDILELTSPTHVLESFVLSDAAKPHGREIRSILKSGLIIKYVEIFDACGPTITDESITALVLSGETRKGGEFVNSRRGEKQWPPLEIFEVDVLDAAENEDGNETQTDNKFQTKISSTDIRRRVHQRFGASRKH